LLSQTDSLARRFSGASALRAWNGSEGWLDVSKDLLP
jgi:hypothetical protein